MKKETVKKDPKKLNSAERKAWTMATDLAAANYRLAEARRMFNEANDELKIADKKLNDIEKLMDGLALEKDLNVEEKVRALVRREECRSVSF